MAMVSPNDLQKAAIDMMLDGNKPRSSADWTLCANFWAANIQKGLEVSALPVIAMLFDCPLKRDELQAIATYQHDCKQETV
jgi:hypothetical protein